MRPVWLLLLLLIILPAPVYGDDYWCGTSSTDDYGDSVSASGKDFYVVGDDSSGHILVAKFGEQEYEWSINISLGEPAVPVDTVVNETVLYILAAGNVHQTILIALNTSSRTILWARSLGHAEAPTSIRARAVAMHGSTLYVLGEDANTGYVIAVSVNGSVTGMLSFQPTTGGDYMDIDIYSGGDYFLIAVLGRTWVPPSSRSAAFLLLVKPELLPSAMYSSDAVCLGAEASMDTVPSSLHVSGGYAYAIAASNASSTPYSYTLLSIYRFNLSDPTDIGIDAAHYTVASYVVFMKNPVPGRITGDLSGGIYYAVTAIRNGGEPDILIGKIEAPGLSSTWAKTWDGGAEEGARGTAYSSGILGVTGFSTGVTGVMANATLTKSTQQLYTYQMTWTSSTPPGYVVSNISYTVSVFTRSIGGKNMVLITLNTAGAPVPVAEPRYLHVLPAAIIVSITVLLLLGWKKR